jgi:hypothetical protein
MHEQRMSSTGGGQSIDSFYSTGACKSGSGHARCRRSGGQGFRLVSRCAVPTTKPRFDDFCCCSTVSFRTACRSVVLPAALNLTLQPQASSLFPRRDPRDSSVPSRLVVSLLSHSTIITIITAVVHLPVSQSATNRLPFLQNNPNSHHQGLPPPQPLQHPRQAGLIQQHRPDSPLQPHGIHHSSQSPYLSPHSSTHSVPQHHSPYVGSVPSLPSQHGADPNYFTAHPSPYSANSAAGSYASSGTPLPFSYLSVLREFPICLPVRLLACLPACTHT